MRCQWLPIIYDFWRINTFFNAYLREAMIQEVWPRHQLPCNSILIKLDFVNVRRGYCPKKRKDFSNSNGFSEDYFWTQDFYGSEFHLFFWIWQALNSKTYLKQCAIEQNLFDAFFWWKYLVKIIYNSKMACLISRIIFLIGA